MPTYRQLLAAASLCQVISNFYQPIQLFRYDPRLQSIYIQAGELDDIALIIDEAGEWEFVP
ncbi:MAG: hypothetical protein DCF21_12190 [Leptolyngbya sp.]|nr:MAG: hypothetical protein DCF21_12190 [Leptolyngbya sp.]